MNYSVCGGRNCSPHTHYEKGFLMINFILGLSIMLNLFFIVLFIVFYKVFILKFSKIDDSVVDFKEVDDFFNH